MPKKTKKEKLLALQHRHPVSPMRAAEQSATHIQILPPTSYTLPSFTKNSSTTAPIPATPAAYRFLKNDLIKTVTLTVAILVGELLLTRMLPQ